MEFYSMINASNPCPRLAIQGRTLNNPFYVEDIIPLGFSCPARLYEIKIENVGEGIFPARKFWLRVYDSSNNSYSYHDFATGPYTFATSTVADNITRFQIVFRLPTIDNVNPALCNGTLAGFNSLVTSTGQASQSGMGYNWLFTDSTGATQLLPAINTGIDHLYFTNSNIPFGFIDFGSTYYIKVGVWNDSLNAWVYSSTPCSVSTPQRAITNNISGVTCDGNTPFPIGGQIAASSNSPFGYHWRVTNQTTTAQLEFNTTNPYFLFRQDAFGPAVFAANFGFIALNTGYCFEVAVLYSVTPQVIGNYNAPCCYTTPVARINPFNIPRDEIFTEFNAIAYPNPFQDSFNIKIETAGKDQVKVEVFDMIGKLIDSYLLEALSGDLLEIGRSYASGLYNLVISQGDNRKIIKIIKK